MGEALKILGQFTPAANTLTTLYDVPSSFSAAISSIFICNHDPSITATFRISVAKNGAVDSSKQYLYYDLPLLPNDTFVATIGLSLEMNDQVRVESSTNNLSFSVYGVEVGSFPPPPENLAGGDLTGFYPNPTVVAIQTNPVVYQTLTLSDDGHVLTWDGIDGYWEAKPSAGSSGPTGPAGGDLGGTYPNPTVTAIQNNPIHSQSLGIGQDGYVLIWDGIDGYWEAKPIATDNDAVIFENTIANSSENITSNRSFFQSPTNTPISYEGIVNLSSDTTGITLGANGNFVTITGGDQNVVSADYGSIPGGFQNTIFSGSYCVISGGSGNAIHRQYSAVGGGTINIIGSDYGFIGGGSNNNIDLGNTNTSTYSTIVGGISHQIGANAGSSTIGGGNGNGIYNTFATVAGGNGNIVNASYAAIVGGQTNTNNGQWGFLGSGANNTIANAYDVLTGGNGSTTTAGGGGNTIGGGSSNTAGSGAGSDTIAGGASNVAAGGFSTVAGGRLNQANGQYSAVLGGISNISNGLYSSIVGGQTNTNNGQYSTIINGLSCGVSNNYAISGGRSTAANGDYSFAFGNNCATTAESATVFGHFAQSQRFGQLSISSSGSAITGSVGGDAQNGNVTLAAQAPAVSTPFVLKDGAGNEFTLLNPVGGYNQYYSIQVNLIIMANNANVGPVYIQQFIMAHTAGGIAIIDNQTTANATGFTPSGVPDPYSTGWLYTVTVDGSTNVIHININPNTDTTSIINACADVRWVEVSGFAQ